jgi:hypothetical protein
MVYIITVNAVLIKGRTNKWWNPFKFLLSILWKKNHGQKLHNICFFLIPRFWAYLINSGRVGKKMLNAKTQKEKHAIASDHTQVSLVLRTQFTNFCCSEAC